MIDLCLDVVFTHSPELFVKLGGYFMGAQVLNGLRGQRMRVKNLCFCISDESRYDTEEQQPTDYTVSDNRSAEIPDRAPLDCT